MKIETLIYAYLAICLAMIIFNLVCVVVFRRRDAKLVRRSTAFCEKITEQAKLSEPDAKHRKYLSKKLCRVSNLMAFDETLERLYADNPEKIRRYIEALSPMFIYLTLEYLKKNKLKAAYFPYIIKKYGIFRGQHISIISDLMLELVNNQSLYCRENALQALYSIGDCESVVKALTVLDGGTYYHDKKLITDGLLKFTGDAKKLSELLWQKFSDFSVTMQVAVLNYFRFFSGDYCAEMLRLMTDSGQNAEIRYCCIRYFGKYRYQPAFPYLIDFVAEEDSENWEFAAIAATALAAYPSEKTAELLKEKLSSRNWYVRFNAAQSLEMLGFDYMKLIDVFEGDDRYAGEMMRYRLDRKKLPKKEATTV